MTIVEFLTARLDEDQAQAEAAARASGAHWTTSEYADDVTNTEGGYVACGPYGYLDDRTRYFIARHDPTAVLSDIASKRSIIEFHKQWPILVDTPAEFESDTSADLGSLTVQMSRRIAWLTEQEYRDRFGDEPPTGPILLALASAYRGHPDYQQEWAK